MCGAIGFADTHSPLALRRVTTRLYGSQYYFTCVNRNSGDGASMI